MTSAQNMKYRQMIWSTDTIGMPVVIHFPDPMATVEVEELKELIGLWLRQMERRAAALIVREGTDGDGI